MECIRNVLQQRPVFILYYYCISTFRSQPFTIYLPTEVDKAASHKQPTFMLQIYILTTLFSSFFFPPQTL
uniref:Uncharacterized protein n=1 Tax=Octopus bimaculoides TaxID=37653 RepID=A0A0L8IF30_OCTBM